MRIEKRRSRRERTHTYKMTVSRLEGSVSEKGGGVSSLATHPHNLLSYELAQLGLYDHQP